MIHEEQNFLLVFVQENNKVLNLLLDCCASEKERRKKDEHRKITFVAELQTGVASSSEEEKVDSGYDGKENQ